MIRLAARTLRHRAGGFIAAFIAMLLGAVIVMACGGLMETGIRTSVPPRQLAGADIVVAGDQGYEVPHMGYTAILPERVRIDAGLVDSIAALPGVVDATGYVFDDPAPPGTIDAIAVAAAAATGTDQLRERIDAELPEGVVTFTGDQRGLAERPQAMLATDTLISLAGVFGALAIMVSIFGVASMLGLSVQQRHRELALLRAIGGTPGQLRTLVLGETVILAVIATAIAVLPGRWLGGFILKGLVDAEMVAHGIGFRMGWIPTAIAIASIMLAAVGGAVAAGGRAAKTRPTQALAEAGLPERRPVGVARVILGLALLAGGAALAIVTMTVLSGPLASSTGMPAAIVCAIGLAVLSPLLTRPLAVLLGWPIRLLAGQPGRLAMHNSRAAIDRTAAAVAPVIVLTGVASGMLYIQSTEQNAIRQEFAQTIAFDVAVTASEGVDAGLVKQISGLPGVAEASAYVRSTGFLEQPHDGSYRWDSWILHGVAPQGIGTILPITITDGTADDLHGAAVALNTRHAGELGVGVGAPMTLRMGDNTRLDVEVVALYAADDDHDTLVLPADVLAAHTTAGRVTTILIAGDATTGADQIIAGIEALTSGEDALTVSDRAALLAAFDEAPGTQSFAIHTIVATIMAYTAISVINALASSTTARRREFGLQRLTGFTRTQVLRMLTTEGTLLAMIGILLGTISALATLIAFSIGRADTIHPTGPPAVYAAVVSVAAALTLLAILVPGWWVTRQRPAQAVG
ncbi:FtsX-like permease family protein [Micromonospora zhanjiangensis]|uniref:FtsX-like permease family protein n=1 Tax=Micromonospora zhanjiangensis TaxID=1522057 RepID=A0ABV8KX25_9ACTN